LAFHAESACASASLRLQVKRMRINYRNPRRNKRWAIAEGYIPGWSHGPSPQMESHETVCLLNASGHEARCGY